MIGTYVFAACLLHTALAGVSIQRLKRLPEVHSKPTHALITVGSEHEFVDSGHYGGDFDEHHITVESGKSSSGAELTSLAHSSVIQANNAVKNQQSAGNQAAFGVKSSLASAALGAAQTAQAAFVGKRAIVQNLRNQLDEAQRQLQEEIAQSRQIEAVSQLALATSQQVQEQLNTLNSFLASAQSGAQAAERAASEAANAAAGQQNMVGEAKQRVSNILGQLHSALGYLQETEASAYKAAEAAQVAQSNAAAAGLAVVAASAKGSQHGVSGHHY